MAIKCSEKDIFFPSWMITVLELNGKNRWKLYNFSVIKLFLAFTYQRISLLRTTVCVFSFRVSPIVVMIFISESSGSFEHGKSKEI